MYIQYKKLRADFCENSGCASVPFQYQKTQKGMSGQKGSGWRWQRESAYHEFAGFAARPEH